MRFLFDNHHRHLLTVFWVVMLLTLLGVTPAAADVVTLADAFSAATPGSGYDTMLELDPANSYTGGLVLPAGIHCIVGNGATIDLEGGSVAAGSGVVFDASGVSFINGNMGLDFTTGSLGRVEFCNFIGNYDGLRAWEGASVTLLSCNFIDNDHYGVYRHEYGGIFNAYNNAWNNAVNDYVYFCPG